MWLDLFGGCQSPKQKNCNWSCFPFFSKTVWYFFSSCMVNLSEYRGLPQDPSNWAENFTLWPNWMPGGSGSVVQTKFLKLCYFYCIINQYPKRQKKPLLPPFVPSCSIPVPVLPLPWSRQGLDNPFGSILVPNTECYCSAKSYINLNCHLSPLTTPLISIFHLKKKACLFLKTWALWPQQHPDFSSTHLGIRICLH